MAHAEGLPVVEIAPETVKVKVQVGEEKPEPIRGPTGAPMRDKDGNTRYHRAKPIVVECYASLIAGARDMGLSPATVRHWVKVGRLQVKAVGLMETGAHTDMVAVADLRLVAHKRRGLLKGGVNPG